MPSPVESSYISSISELIAFFEQYKQQRSSFSKDAVVSATTEKFNLRKNRSVYYNDRFAIRFSAASGSSFSNTIAGLSRLRLYDQLPFFVCVVRPEDIELLLANSTFLKKISHSSQRLRFDNVCGSFLGHDILRKYEGIANIPQNFEQLFLIHQEFTWEENLARLVEATNNIVPTGSRYTPTPQEKSNILASADLAHMLSSNSEYISLGTTLNQLVEENKTAILEAGRINNVNVRGNQIEQIVTNAANFHGVEDLSYTLSFGSRVLIDIKTKILTLASSPKGYNIDKALKILGTGNTVFCFFFIGLSLEGQAVSTRLISALDSSVLNSTRIQFHWAGRNSRGVTQLTGDLSFIFSPDHYENINVEQAKNFLQELIAYE
ncbi:hypothetical protein H6F67_26080 [Microcoleus sp. FACHB-1515]|uniref:hypothetical protein n=1 Tax=Cyanophyceae TaxID=3028117 RepID=UPI00168806BF|nr:hypothetical protein [Microcoleus sp. FACHB-1515]MBD2093318.1 hypothetical protein [Microcoleus sp. FACHB-1515]